MSDNYPDVEFIFIDDASADAGADLITPWLRSRAGCLITFAERRGVAWARDAGIKASAADYIWFCDADDEPLPHILSMLVGAMEAAPGGCVLAACRALRIAGTEETLMEGVDATTIVPVAQLPVMLFDGTLRGYTWNKLFRTSILRRAIPVEPLSSQQDFLLVNAYLKAALDTATDTGGTEPHSCAVLVPEVGYRYLVRAGSVTHSTQLKLQNTSLCADAAEHTWLPELTSGAVNEYLPRVLRSHPTWAIAGFRTWFEYVACAATPVAQRWTEPERTNTVRHYASKISIGGTLGAIALGQQRVAAHAVVLRLFGTTTLYRLIYERWLR